MGFCFWTVNRPNKLMLLSSIFTCIPDRTLVTIESNSIFAEFVEWKVAWVPKRCNEMAHNLATAWFGKEGFFSEDDIFEYPIS